MKLPLSTVPQQLLVNGKTAPTSKASSVAWGWSLMSSVWSDKFGYPCAVTLCEQRLFCGDTYERPQTIWMSRTAEYLNFQLSTEDDDAAAFTMSSDQINPIVHLTQTDTPIVLTYGGEFSCVIHRNRFNLAISKSSL